jgi:hypothetical protein
MIERPFAKTAVALLRHDENLTLALGCVQCPERKLCGGYHVEAGMFSCLDHCNCSDKAACDVVCPNNPIYSDFIKEVGGLDLGKIEKRDPLPTWRLPDIIPLFYRSPKLAGRIGCAVAAIPFNETYRRSGRTGTALTRSELEEKFKFGAGTKLVLSGIEHDRHVEQWWSSGGRKELLAGIRRLGVLLATTPNFSTMLDVPRHDNLHALKRIALVWAELHDARIPTALHLNALNEQDFRSLHSFLTFHTEISVVSFEYTTGSAIHKWGEFYTGQLVHLARTVGRPLTLVLRGGVQWLHLLMPEFQRITLLDTNPAMLTLYRRRAVLAPGGRLRSHKYPTRAEEALDELLAHNLEVSAQYLRLRRAATAPQPARPASDLKVKRHADQKASEGSLL